MIKCDICGADITPDEDLFGDTPSYEMVNINGKLCFCPDCYIALGEYLRSGDFEKCVKEYKKQFEE